MTMLEVEEVLDTLNTSQHRIHNEGERYLWVVYNVVVALSSLLGDTIVLAGTIKYNAINLHRIVVVIIQHLAVSDLLLTLFRVCPSIVSLLADSWIIGHFLCKFLMNAQWLVYWMTGILTICLAISKLLLVKYPLRTRFCTRRRAHMTCGILWALTLVTPPQLLFMADHSAIYFDYTMYFCMYDFSTSRNNPNPGLLYAAIIFAGIVQTFMYIALPVASVLLVLEARKAAQRLGEHVRWQGVLTVTLCTFIYFISTLPAILVAGICSVNSSLMTEEVRRAAHFFTNLNVMTNFFVYCLAVVSFREFLKSKLRELGVKLGVSTPAKPARRISRAPATRTQSTEQSSLHFTSL